MIVAAGGTVVQAPAIDLDMATEFLATRFGDKASDVETVAQGEVARIRVPQRRGGPHHPLRVGGGRLPARTLDLATAS
jgi:hypothetical protein